MAEQVCKGCHGRFWWYRCRDYCNNCQKYMAIVDAEDKNGLKAMDQKK